MGYSFQPDLFDHEPSTLQEGRYRIAEALNHNPQAATMYRANHPCTRIWIQDIRGVPPEVVAAGRRIGLAWFSPDCTFHSKARGAAPIRKADQPIRDLPEVVIDWAKLERPRVIMLENVEEIVKWGPLDGNGNRIKHLEGLYWDRWVAALRELGYVVEWRELRGCDYGAPTSRKRLFVIARCDGRPIVWPKPTYVEGRDCTHFQVYEEWTEGSPVSPVFATEAEAQAFITGGGVMRTMNQLHRQERPALAALSDDFEAWLKREKNPAEPPTNPLVSAVLLQAAAEESRRAADTTRSQIQ